MTTPTPKPLVIFAHRTFSPDIAGNPAALLTDGLSGIGQDLYDGLIHSLGAWDKTLKAGGQPSELYDLMAADVSRHQARLTAAIHGYPLSAATVQGILQMWSSYILTWHVLREALGCAEGPASIEIARQLGGIVSLPEGFSLPEVFLSIQGESAVETPGSRPGARSHVSAQGNRGGADKPGDGAIPVDGLCHILRLAPWQVERIEKGVLTHLRTEAERFE